MLLVDVCSSSPYKRSNYVLTSGDDYPNNVHSKVIDPKVVCFGPTVNDILVVEIKHASRIVKDISVDLAQRYQCLEWVAERVPGGDRKSNKIGERTPADLKVSVKNTKVEGRLDPRQ